LVAAVVNAGVIQVYKLPPASKQDVKDLELAKSFSPPVSEAPVSFARLETPVDEAKGDVAAANGGDAVTAGGGSAPAAKVAPAADVSGGGPAGGPGPAAGDVTRAGKAEPGAAEGAGVAAKDGQSAPASGDAGELTRRKPPTLLEPGETTETVKGSGPK
jgi:hypothetical protein